MIVILVNYFIVINCELAKIFELKCKSHAKDQMVHVLQDRVDSVLKSAVDRMLKICTLNAMTADLADGFMESF